jgi:hypothetical protein
VGRKTSPASRERRRLLALAETVADPVDRGMFLVGCLEGLCAAARLDDGHVADLRAALREDVALVKRQTEARAPTGRARFSNDGRTEDDK